MNFQVNTNITVFIDGHNDCYAQQQVYVQWHTCLRDNNGNWVIDPNKLAKTAIIASATSTLTYTAWKALTTAAQLSAIQTFILSQY